MRHIEAVKRHYRSGYYEKLPPNTKLVSRPSRWGNPYSLKDYSLEESLNKFREYLFHKLIKEPDFLDPLIGFDLACYCPLDQSCHADIIINFLTTKGLCNNCYQDVSHDGLGDCPRCDL